MEKVDVIIIGAGAAGLFCAIEAGKRGRRVLLLDHANKAGKKILMSGGGFCNFTNYGISPERYLSKNPHFCKSALSRYTQWDFIDLVKRHRIPFHEKTLGQLFCDNKSQDIVNLLLNECELAHVDLRLHTKVERIEKTGDRQFHLTTSRGDFVCESLVVACGGLSIPTMGATPFGYHIAEQFGLSIRPTRAGLVPFTLHDIDKQKFSELSGVSIDCVASTKTMSFRENMLFTHRGLSGPAMLQISSYWNSSELLTINFLPEIDVAKTLKSSQKGNTQQIKNFFSQWLPKRFITTHIPISLAEKTLASLSYQEIDSIARLLNQFEIKPNATEGYRTAEVTLGGVDVDAISSKTFEANAIAGLFFIGEVLDVSGWLGGYNFQWAWSSGFAAGNAV